MKPLCRKIFKLAFISVSFVTLLLLIILQQVHFILKDYSSFQCTLLLPEKTQEAGKMENENVQNAFHHHFSNERLDRENENEKIKADVTGLTKHSQASISHRTNYTSQPMLQIFRESAIRLNQNNNLSNQRIANDKILEGYINTSSEAKAIESGPNGDHNVKDISTIEKFFKQGLSNQTSAFMFDLLDKFRGIAMEANITWFLAWGSLLGSYQCHDILPWDDDLDVMMPRASRARLSEAISRSLGPLYVFEPSNAARYWKFYSMNGLNTRQKWKFPFIDVFTYHEDEEKIWGKNFIHSKVYIFPLAKRPFHRRKLPCPRDPRLFLQNSYRDIKKDFSVDACEVGSYDHRLEQDKQREDLARVRCGALSGRMPVVRHRRVEQGPYCREDLILRGAVINTFVRSAKGISVC